MTQKARPQASAKQLSSRRAPVRRIQPSITVSNSTEKPFQIDNKTKEPGNEDGQRHLYKRVYRQMSKRSSARVYSKQVKDGEKKEYKAYGQQFEKKEPLKSSDFADIDNLQFDLREKNKEVKEIKRNTFMYNPTVTALQARRSQAALLQTSRILPGEKSGTLEVSLNKSQPEMEVEEASHSAEGQEPGQLLRSMVYKAHLKGLKQKLEKEKR